jgi:phytanoyl-CoA hydroxylase
MAAVAEAPVSTFDPTDPTLHWNQPMPERLNALTREQLQFYRDNGYLLLKNVFTKAEAAEFRRECHALADRLARHASIDATWNSARQIAGTHTVIQHCHDPQFYVALLSKMIVDDRLTGPAADLIGPNVQLHHTKMFIKPPEKGSPFPMHQDYPYFVHTKHSMIAAIVHFDDAPIEKGCVRVYPGSHKLGPLPTAIANHSLDPEKYPIEKGTPCPAEAGDVLFFSYLTIHGSGLNTSSEARTTCLVQMRDPEDAPINNLHRSRGQCMMLRGIDPTASRPMAWGT